MKDMIGSVAGIGHTTNLTSANNGATAMSKTAAGVALQTATDNYNNAVKVFIDANPGTDSATVLADPTVAAAAATLNTATTAFGAAVTVIPSLSSMMSGINTSVTASVTALATEVDNLAKAGLEMVDNLGAAIEQAFNKGYQTILAFGSKLHKMGQDIQNLGFNDFLPKMATANVAGDALQASLVEGRNVSRSASVAQSTPIVAEEKKEISAAQTENLEALKTAYLNAAKEKDLASKALFGPEARGPNANAISARYESAGSAKSDAEEAMKSAARAAGVPASELPVYKSNNSFN
jgi:hypothetical protein